MKKLLLRFVVVFGLLCADIALAQENYPVFSSSLGGGSSYATTGTRRTMYTPRGYVAQRQQPVRKQQVCKKTVIKYQPGQMALTDAEKEKHLGPIIQKLQKGEVKRVSIVGFAREYGDAFNRVNPLSRFFFAYGISAEADVRTGLHVVSSNENTVEITACN